MRPLVEKLVSELLAPGPRELSLDEVGTAVGSHAITQDEIDQMLTLLEEAGCTVSGATQSVRQQLRQVLDAARALRALQGSGTNPSDSAGRAPTVSAIAERAGLTLDEVRAALRYAQVLSR